MHTFIPTLAHSHPWGFYPWFPFLWIGLWIIVAIVVFRRFGQRRRWSNSPEAVLGELYARGEITETEYRSRLAVLREKS
jgi:putative membrane protein